MTIRKFHLPGNCLIHFCEFFIIGFIFLRCYRERLFADRISCSLYCINSKIHHCTAAGKGFF